MMKIQNITDKAFARYGKILKGYDLDEMMQVMKMMPMQEGKVLYEASVPELENLSIAEKFQNTAFGGMPIEIGYCNGYNQKMNGLEYHRCSEVNVAVTDVIVILGRQQDIEDDFTYDTAKAEAFFVPAGTALEVYATTLHYAPCMTTEEGFRWVVVLPKGTNGEAPVIENAEGEDKLIAGNNKWLLVHKDSGEEGYCGLKGENWQV